MSNDHGVADDAAGYVGLPVYRSQLAEALDFTEADLDTNRQGRLGDHQRSLLVRGVARNLGLGIVFALLAVGCVIGAFAVGVANGLGLRILLVAGCMLAFAALLAWYGIPVWMDVRAGAVSSIEGMVREQEKETDVGTGPTTHVPIWTYYWTVDGRRFNVRGRAWAALTPARHRVYFLPGSRKLVAAEPVAPGARA